MHSRLIGCVLSGLSFLILFPAFAEKQPVDRTIVTSFYPMYIMTRNIARDVPGIKVVNLTNPSTGCLHDYQLTPREVVTLSSAWALVINGRGMESFLNKVIEQQPHLTIIDASRGISLFNKNPDAARQNPHVWVSISGAIAEVRNINTALALADPEHAALYQKNSDRYCAKLEALKLKMHQTLDPLPHRSIITFHEAFPYFAQEFNLTIVSVIEREPGSAPSAGELAATIKIVNNQHVRALFAEPQYPAKAAEAISRETGAKVYILDPGVSGEPDNDAYLKIMENNCAALKEALQ